MKIDPNISWMQSKRRAHHWIKNDDRNSSVTCKLSPRNCTIQEGRMGHCGVRGNVGGELHTFNYGKSVEATLEYIETEAIYHFRPGSKIISLGNIGCMMSCDFCQNWRTSQVRHLDSEKVCHYTPEEIVEACKIAGVNVISWTYNDPVVWHEFVIDTSRLARENGISTLYKSAFYIEPAAVDELIDCIDIFSISLKSMDDRFYRKFSGGARLDPVLDMIKRVHRSDRHLEISQLIITDRNDDAKDIEKTNLWVIENLGDRVPLHYVGFHPAYLYVNTTRTPPETLLMARDMAFEAGIKHCYVGNMFQEGVADTRCTNCDQVTVSRFGLQAETVGLRADGRCTNCGTMSNIRDPLGAADEVLESPSLIVKPDMSEFVWNGEAQSVHVEIKGTDQNAPGCPIIVERLGTAHSQCQTHALGGILKRIIVSKQDVGETGIRVSAPAGTDIAFFPVLDRAHFPTSTEIDKELSGYQKNPPAATEGSVPAEQGLTDKSRTAVL